MSIPINYDDFEEMIRPIKDEEELFKLECEGWRSTTNLFEKYFKEKYKHNDPEDRKHFEKLFGLLREIGQKNPEKCAKREFLNKYKGIWFHPDIYEEFERQYKEKMRLKGN